MYTFYFSLYLYWRVCGYVNDLICWQRGHLCKANVRRHQSFHHHGEPLRPKVSLERRVLRLLTAWHVSLGYVKASEVQCEVIMASQSFEKNAAWIFLICQVVELRSPHHVQWADEVTANELVTTPTHSPFFFFKAWLALKWMKVFHMTLTFVMNVVS